MDGFWNIKDHISKEILLVLFYFFYFLFSVNDSEEFSNESLHIIPYVGKVSNLKPHISVNRSNHMWIKCIFPLYILLFFNYGPDLRPKQYLYRFSEAPSWWADQPTNTPSVFSLFAVAWSFHSRLVRRSLIQTLLLSRSLFFLYYEHVNKWWGGVEETVYRSRLQQNSEQCFMGRMWFGCLWCPKRRRYILPQGSSLSLTR